jgi:ABC-type uncharacterized transport system auxiliary subunit
MTARAAPFALAALFVCSVLVGAGSGCGGQPRTRRYFALAPEVAEPQEGADSVSRPRIRVAELACADAYDDRAVVFRLSAVELRSFRYAEWTSKPGVMVAEVLRRYLAASGHFTIVSDEDTADLEVGGRVDVIEQVVDDDGWHGRLELLISLRRLRDGRVVWQHRIDGVQPAERRDVAEVVAAQSRILGAGLAEALPGLTEAAIAASVGPPAGATPSAE